MLIPGQRRGSPLVHRHLELFLGHLNLEIATHPAPDTPRRLASTIATRSSGPSRESTVPASADSTVQPHVPLSGIRGCAAVTETVIVTRSVPSSNTHSRSVPGIAWDN